ncbi:MAG: hypothetical protein NXY57DRAFT_795498 [Lentinula lateritia]|uniref:K Homology domain-containing protein n=1 Tax=Lentinula lateritia TaxID=40482 RepID=A0ABQ8VPA5_9AGAR|nr:hypothetical protein EV359DRAFT_71712 [Lentinula novae-zelandiae]KAJ3933583.1 MAG: hypothetical protein NXY57DRAFT_795498 [Lentinula lateritia]KAJ4498227.1 hypothetical protein C8R41DRAFT_894286 [Lentinula lateritia]
MSTPTVSNAAAGSGSSKQASEAAAAAAAIAAKIAAQFASGGAGSMGGSLNDAAFTFDIDINDARNRYMLCKSSTQQDIQEDTGASISTKGTWHPNRSKATERDPPLYLHIMAPTKEVLDKAIKKVEELLAIDMGSLVEDKKDKMGGRRKWPEEKMPVGLESIRNFNLRAKVVGPSGSFVKYIQQETGTRVQIKGVGSGFVEQETGRESDDPLYIHITGPEESQVARAKVLTEDLLLVVRAEHAKMQAVVQAQQMELHQAQQQYAAYAASYQGGGGYPGGATGGYGGGYVPPPPGDAPPPPPGDAQPPPPPPSGGGSDPSAATAASAGGTPQEQYAAYWAAYGYDVNSPEFKTWVAEQAKQTEQYYAQQQAQAQGAYPGYDPSVGTGGAAAPPPPPPPDSQAPPPPPPPA